MVYFHDKTLTYYRGNYDTFEAVREEKIKNQVTPISQPTPAADLVL